MPVKNNIVNITSAIKKPTEGKRSSNGQPELSDQAIHNFFQVLDYIRSLSTDKTATIEVSPDELTVICRHCNETQEGQGTVLNASVLQLTSSMEFEGKDGDVEDFRDVVDYLTLD